MSEQTEAPKQPLDVYDFLGMIAEQTASIAWTKLGLQPDLVTGTISPNLEQAKVAIDLVAFVAGQIDGQLDEADKRRVHSLVRDLKLNYVEKLKEG
jgi:uncharacterized protein DUF1844